MSSRKENEMHIAEAGIAGVVVLAAQALVVAAMLI